MSKLRVGIIGLGFIGMAKHMPALATLSDELEVVGFCDLQLERAEAARSTYGSADSYTTTDWRKIVDDPSLDVVHVCTWNRTHCEFTVAALNAGKHVMCEKPMALTGAEARQMVDAAKANDRKLTVGYQYRLRRDAQFLRRAVDEGRLGEIYHAKAHAVRRRGVPIWGCFMDKDKQGGGPLVDLGGHALDLALWYMGNYEVASVSGSVFSKLRDKPEGNIGGEWDPTAFTVEDSAFGYITMKNGACVFLEAAWALNVKESREACVTLAGVDGGAELAQTGLVWTPTLNHVVGGELVTTAPDFGGEYFGTESRSGDSPFLELGAREARLWVDAIKNDGQPLVRAEQACVVTEVLDAVYRSAATGQTVRFDPEPAVA